jgi:hypothetical protein
LDGCKYVSVVDGRGISVERKGKQELIECDRVVVCAGQVRARKRAAALFIAHARRRV